MMTAVMALSLVSCDNSNAYKAKGEQMAKQLDQLCEQRDSVAVLALDDSIRAQGDSVAIAAFREALKESRERNAPYISTLKVSKGMSDEEVAKEIINDVMEGDMSINAVTESIDEMLKNKK